MYVHMRIDLADTLEIRDGVEGRRFSVVRRGLRCGAGSG
jgi:hypothetical protein